MHRREFVRLSSVTLVAAAATGLTAGGVGGLTPKTVNPLQAVGFAEPPTGGTLRVGGREHSFGRGFCSFSFRDARDRSRSSSFHASLLRSSGPLQRDFPERQRHGAISRLERARDQQRAWKVSRSSLRSPDVLRRSSPEELPGRNPLRRRRSLPRLHQRLRGRDSEGRAQRRREGPLRARPHRHRSQASARNVFSGLAECHRCGSPHRLAVDGRRPADPSRWSAPVRPWTSTISWSPSIGPEALVLPLRRCRPFSGAGVFRLTMPTLSLRNATRFLLLALSLPAFAATWYVQGDASAGDGSRGAPFSSLDAAEKASAAGDTIVLMAAAVPTSAASR